MGRHDVPGRGDDRRQHRWPVRGIAVGACWLGAVVVTGSLRRIGAYPGEVAASLPGDALVTAGDQHGGSDGPRGGPRGGPSGGPGGGPAVVGRVHTSTHATTIAASPSTVWPWLVQMGHRRGGWYAADRLEALMGAGDFATGRSADRVVPELQDLAEGDAMPLSDRLDLTVARLDAPRTLVLTLDDGPLVWVWSFHLRGGTPGAGSSRLVVRTRIGARRGWIRPLLLPLDAGHAAMQTLQLARLRRRIEQPTRR